MDWNNWNNWNNKFEIGGIQDVAFDWDRAVDDFVERTTLYHTRAKLPLSVLFSHETFPAGNSEDFEGSWILYALLREKLAHVRTLCSLPHTFRTVHFSNMDEAIRTVKRMTRALSARFDPFLELEERLSTCLERIHQLKVSRPEELDEIEKLRMGPKEKCFSKLSVLVERTEKKINAARWAVMLTMAKKVCHEVRIQIADVVYRPHGPAFQSLVHRFKKLQNYRNASCVYS